MVAHAAAVTVFTIVEMRIAAAFLLLLGCGPVAPPTPGLKTERFDRDPGWDGRNNRSPESREIRQDFGYDAARGKVGGRVTPAAEPAFTAKVLPTLTLNDPFRASGTLTVEPGAGNTLVGFFNASTVNEWRTPNSVVLRINGRGDGFHVHLEYATARWRAGADAYSTRVDGKSTTRLMPAGSVAWSLAYDPAGDGAVRATVNGEELRVPLDPGHKADGATLNRFGILNVVKSADSEGVLWLDDVTVNGILDRFDSDPRWESMNARRTYTTANVRPRFDFGFSATRHAGGSGSGELGGLVFRGDQRYPDKIAHYGDRLQTMSLDRPLRASGKVGLRRAVTDSTVLIGFYHSEGSLRVGPSQASGFPENFLGVAIEGPSREGFLFYPVYATDQEGEGGHGSREPGVPHILPDGTSHAWSLTYSPEVHGSITVTLDGKSVSLALTAGHRKLGAWFDRFGIVTTHIDGNGQHVYFDDLTYTVDQDPR